MTTPKEFTDKWNIAYEDREQEIQFEKEMQEDIMKIVNYHVEKALQEAQKQMNKIVELTCDMTIKKLTNIK